MGAILYYLSLPFIYLLSILPFRVLYILSDALYIILYRIAGYRKGVVLNNLRNSFPDKTEAEIHVICNGFYKNLCDLFLETFKTLTVSKKTMLKHCYFNVNTTRLFNDLATNNRNCIIVMGHYGNWEWGGNTFSLMCKQQLYVIYHPLDNKYFNGLICSMRSRFGTKLIAMKDTFKAMLSHKNELNATAFIADQTPFPEHAYWTTFLNQDTPVFKGTEVIGKKLDYPIVYLSIKKVKRGYYEMFAEILIANSKAIADGQISEAHTKKLEQDIIAQPENWLWSHKRWKYKRP